MKKLMLYLVYLLYVVLSNPMQAQTTPNKGDSHNSRNSLNWDGIYRGVLPCADCEGLQTTITLSRNMNYKVSTKYIGKSDSVHIYAGRFSWNKEGSIVSLSDSGGHGWKGMYLVGEGILTQLDGDGKKIMGELANRFILSKSAYAIIEKYWKLVELNGKAVVIDSTYRREPYITLKDQGNRIVGFSGCNNLTGKYTITPVDRLSLSQMASTRMACPQLDFESEFLKALQAADSFTISGDQLVLNRARMAPLARFKTVYMK